MSRWLFLAAAVSVWTIVQHTAAHASDPLVFAVQEALVEEGYGTGKPDGVIGPRTRAAIREFEADYSLPETGELNADLVHVLGLAAYASELGVMTFDSVRMLAPPTGAAAAVISGNATYDTDAETGPAKTAPPSTKSGHGQGPSVASAGSHGAPVFRVRDFHPLLPAALDPGKQKAVPAVKQPVVHKQTEPQVPQVRHEKLPPLAVQNAVVQEKQAAPQIPAVAKRFAPRNWLIRDFRQDGMPASGVFGIFLEEGGKVAGPRFAERLEWSADGVRFTMTYRNRIGQEITRTGMLNGLNRIEGEATGPDGRTWRWHAEAKPL